LTDQKDVVIHVRLPKGLVEKIDQLVEKGLFMSRSEVVRFAIMVVVGEYGKGKE